MEQERLTPQGVIARIKLSEPKRSWQQYREDGPGLSGAIKAERGGVCDLGLTR